MALEAKGFAFGGAAGARLAVRLTTPGNWATLLRVIRAAPVAVRETSWVLGVDNWARCTRQTYGTILVDLERHRVVNLLDARTADTLTAWLNEHPGVEAIAPDRVGAYAEGAPRGAPGWSRWRIVSTSE